MRKSGWTIAVAAAALAAGIAGTGTASAATQRPWRVTLMSPGTWVGSICLYDVAATGASDAWAVGAVRQGAGGSGTMLHWNGTSWNAATIPGGGGSYGQVGGASPHNVWVTGVTATGGEESWHWDGTAWTAVS